LSEGGRGSTNCRGIAQLDSSAAQPLVLEKLRGQPSGIFYVWVVLSLFSSVLGDPFFLYFSVEMECEG
jgi:hypothetical protein